MKKTVVLFIIICVCSVALAEVKSIGIGGMIGDPAGLSGKLWMFDAGAVDLGLSLRTVNATSVLSIHGDYLVHDLKMTDAGTGRMFLYYGVGARILNDAGTSQWGVRVPVGLTYVFEKAPLDMFVELVPTIDVGANSGFSFAGSLGFRFYIDRKESGKEPVK